MSKTIQRSAQPKKNVRRVRPSVSKGGRFTLDQELTPFGDWVDKPIWVPPMDSSKAMARTMLEKNGPLTPKRERWSSVIAQHRADFTQVREIELRKASIRLPKGKFFVTVTEQANFDQITDTVPACVQTRLDEFLAGPGKRPGVKVYYLKPLCVEVGDDLILTDREDLMAAITKIQNEVFAQYRQQYMLGLPLLVMKKIVNACLAIPRNLMAFYVNRKRKAIEAYHARLEFRRRKTALRAAKHHRKCRTNGCTFDEMLALTSPLDKVAVIEQYAIDHELSQAERRRLMRLAAETLPWFVTLSLATAYFTAVSLAAAATPVMVCDPAFVAELPEKPGVLLKIGHFDEVGGVTHVEI